MNPKEINPKTLIAVLTAAIKEDAELIARQIVAQAKNDNLEYSKLVERYVLGKTKAMPLNFSSFAENAFEQVKDTEKLLGFDIELFSSWRLNRTSGVFECYDNNQFHLKAELDHKEKGYTWNDTVHAYGGNVYSLLDEFKASLQSKILEINGEVSEVILPEEIQTENE
ncbi:hypothetical protein D0T49_02020 [Paludibacter sp. 221]|uniref:hypothetical protein n=1 Tax=Paludibacter sp. 221 TaxID=2302939 RepID=UPI0013D572F7|nr:hypothetical protein [Paludibacter sp. 221]NDV45827.1 hypothetical protein [Paludibacter sp. 221]